MYIYSKDLVFKKFVDQLTFFSSRCDCDHMDTRGETPRRIRNGIRYIAVGVVILAAWNFFAPHLGVPSWAPYLNILPVIVGQTESNTFVNATHIVVIAVTAVVVMKI